MVVPWSMISEHARGLDPKIVLDVDVDKEFVGANSNMLRPFMSSIAH